MEDDNWSWRAHLPGLSEEELQYVGQVLRETVLNIINGRLPEEKEGMSKEKDEFLSGIEEAVQGMSWGQRERFYRQMGLMAADAVQTIKVDPDAPAFVPRAGSVADRERWKETRKLDKLQGQSEKLALRRQWEDESRAHRHSDSMLQHIASKYRRLGLQVSWRDALTLDQED